MKIIAPFIIMCFVAGGLKAATLYMIDINQSANSVTESGWTGLDVTGNNSAVTVDGVEFRVGSIDGALLRGTTGSPNPDALVGDFIYDDGAGQAVILYFGNQGSAGPTLQAGTWQVEVWSYDSAAGINNQFLGLRTNNNENAAATINGVLQGNGIVTSTMSGTSSGPAHTFTFLADGSSYYDVFARENNNEDRSRLNAVRLTLVPEPSTFLLAVLSGLFILRRQRA